MTNTLLFYEYRDGANYAVTSAAILAGEISEADEARLRAGLDEGGMFIPGQIGLPDLQDSFVTPSEWSDKYDHPWHRMLDITVTDYEPTLPVSLAEIIEKIESVTWDNDYRPPFFDVMEERRIAREIAEDEGLEP